MGGCDEGQLARAEERIGVRIPESLRSLYLAADGIFDEVGQWWIVWPLDRLVEDNVGARSRGTLDESLVAFGDDGTGDPFCVRLGDDSHVARWSFIDLAVVEKMSFAEFEEK